MSNFVWHAAESRRTAHIRKRGEREAKEKDAEKIEEILNPMKDQLPFGTVDGKYEERLVVSDGCAGILIGKKGANLKDIEKRLKVRIRIEDGHVVIRGDSPRRVATAKNELDFVSEKIDFPPKMSGWVCGKGGRHLKLIRELSGVAVLNLCSQDDTNKSETRTDTDTTSSNQCWFELKGRRETVNNARMCLETHMSYYPVFLEMEEVEQQLDQQLVNAQARLGRRVVLPDRAEKHKGELEQDGSHSQQ